MIMVDGNSDIGMLKQENINCGYFSKLMLPRGCVTGKILQNIQNNIEDPNKPGTYRWDYLDGYEGDDKNSLERHPDLQEKVRRVITQGFIDPEDFNGVSLTLWLSIWTF